MTPPNDPGAERRWDLYICENPDCARAMSVTPCTAPLTTCRKYERSQRMRQVEVAPAFLVTRLEQGYERLEDAYVECGRKCDAQSAALAKATELADAVIDGDMNQSVLWKLAREYRELA